MIKRLLMFGLLASVIQVMFYLLILKTMQLVQAITITEEHKEYISNYGITLSVIIFIAIVTLQNISTTLINRKWFTWTALILVTTFYFVGWGEGINSWPIKTILFLIAGIVTLTSKFLIDKILVKWKTKKKPEPLTSAKPQAGCSA